VAFDFDGTLAPLGPRPQFVDMRPVTRKRLLALARKFPVAVITGRAVSDIRQWTREFPLYSVVGNHGIEIDGNAKGARRYRTQVDGWLKPLAQRLQSWPGVWIENKGYSLSLHFRASPHPKKARHQLKHVARGLPGVRVVPGKDVVNLVPDRSPHKGTAFCYLVRQSKATAAIFVGDDVTDESVFRNARVPGCQVVTIRIGRSIHSKAKYYLKTQKEIDQLLLVLLKEGD